MSSPNEPRILVPSGRGVVKNINASEKIKNRVKLSALGPQTASSKEKQTTDYSTTNN